MQAPGPLARPWRDTPAATPAFSRLAVSRGPARLSISYTHHALSSKTVAACRSSIITLLYLYWLHDWSIWCMVIGFSLCLCFIVMAFVISEDMLSWQQTFTFSEDKWEVACRGFFFFGLHSTRQCASGHTAHLVAARVAATGTTAFQLTTTIQILEAPRAAPTAPPIVNTVYTAGATSVPLSLTEQEFIVAEVNRYLERTRGTSIPDCIENTLFADPGGVAVLAPSTHTDRCPVPPPGLPVFAGGAPFARPVALVPRVPLAGCHVSAMLTKGGLGRESCTIVLKRNLPIYTRLGGDSRMWCLGVWIWYLALAICSNTHPHSIFWVFFVVGLLAGSVQLLISFLTVDQLLLSEHEWVLKQHVLFSKVRRGGQWKHGTVVDSGPLSDLLGAQVPPSTCFNPVLGLRDTFCAPFCISLDPLAPDMLSLLC
jgi:hypothetical protein